MEGECKGDRRRDRNQGRPCHDADRDRRAAALAVGLDRKRKNGILQNRLYIGQLVFNRTRKVVDPRTRRPLIRPHPESEWLVEQVPKLRIIDDELWQEVQAVLGQV